VNGISCVNSSDCWAATANGVIATTDGGTVWTNQPPPTNPEFSDIACANTSDCWAVGNTFGPSGFIMATNDGGTDWTTQTVPTGIGRIYGITCVDAADCWAVGTSTGNAPVIIATTTFGAVWVTQAVPPGFTAFGNGQSRSITCFNTMDCWAVGSSGISPSTTQAVIATTDGGTSWTSQTPPHSGGQLSSVACTSSLDCWAVGTNGTAPTIIVTTNGGSSWSTQTVPSGAPDLTDVACVPGSTSSCWVTGETTSTSGAGAAGFVLKTTNGGTTWSIRATFPETSTSGGGLLSVSCPNASNCWVGAQNVSDTTTSGAIFSTVRPKPPTPPGPYYLALGDSVPVWDGNSSYPNLLLARYQKTVPNMQLMNLAVSGETTSSMLGGQYTSALAFLRAHQNEVRLITIDIGGNDVVGCYGSSNPQCLPQAEASMEQNIATMLAGLHAAAPGTPIFGMTYYDPFLGDWLAGGTTQSQALATISETVTLNHDLTALYGTGNTAHVQQAFAVADSTTLVTSQWGTAPVDVVNACQWLDITCTSGQPEGFGDDPNVAGQVQIALAFERAIGRTLTTEATTGMLVPSNNATLSGTQATLDASAVAGVTRVVFELSSNGLSESVIGTATPTLYGWIDQWNTTGVANGTYTLRSVASFPDGVTETSTRITVTVSN
jgi:lysophospholipase L1-like esterase